MDPNQQPQQEPQPQFTNYAQEQPQVQPPTQIPPAPPSPVTPKQKRDKRSLIMLAVILLLILTIGILGYMLVKSRSSASNDNLYTSEAAIEEENENTNIDPVDSEITNETADWKTETFDAYGFGYKYPGEEGWLSYLDDTNEPAGTKASGGVTYNKCGTNCGLVITTRIVTKGSAADPGDTYGDTAMQGNTHFKLSSKEAITKTDVTGTRWEYTPGDDKSAKIVYYYFVKGDSAFMFEVNTNGAVTDKLNITEEGEKIMKTLVFEG